MKKNIVLPVIALILSMASYASARDALVQFSIQDALNNPRIQSELHMYSQVKMYWGEQEHPEPKTVFGDFRTSQRTNALGKGREEACQWALASSLKQLLSRVLREGGNAVVNIKSNVKHVEKSSQTEFDCLAGSVMVNVALKGTVVKLAE